ncbi:hypothetical protein ERHA55_03120 [Erwinia rhapontici]|nr:hypothetical protein ERHA55_03120 [Erwinia rhapontici]
MSLLSKVKQPDAQGRIQHVTPESAGWRYVGFDAYQLKKGQTLTLESGSKELCLVLVAGLASVKTRQAEFPNIGKRMSPFERTPLTLCMFRTTNRLSWWQSLTLSWRCAVHRRRKANCLHV